MAHSKTITIDFRFWLFSDKEKVVGKGRIELLELIEKSGSISKASKEMKMSYRQAWQMVQEMNDRARLPLVEKKLGGKQGGGAKVTQEGLEMIQLFYTIQNLLKNFIDKEINPLL